MNVGDTVIYRLHPRDGADVVESVLPMIVLSTDVSRMKLSGNVQVRGGLMYREDVRFGTEPGEWSRKFD